MKRLMRRCYGAKEAVKARGVLITKYGIHKPRILEISSEYSDLYNGLQFCLLKMDHIMSSAKWLTRSGPNRPAADVQGLRGDDFLEE